VSTTAREWREGASLDDAPGDGRSRDGAAAARALRAEVLAGLRATPRALPPKLFYDARGAALFEAITELPEYYLTRAELAILGARAGEIAACVGPGSVLVELGSGGARKVRLLLDALRHAGTPAAAFAPVDVSEAQLAEAAAALARDYPATAVHPLAADFSAPGALPALGARLDAVAEGRGRGRGGRRVLLFLGSTIGNLHPHEAAAFLRDARALCGADGALLLGADLRKDPAVLHAAYNDAAGVTAEFNRNVLVRLARELGATFDVERFRHYAFYDPVAHRVEMHLVSLVDQRVRVGGEELELARGESIWTESSYKYDGRSMAALLAGAGWVARTSWRDPGDAFGLWYCEPAAGL
jgi:dimethylhistidine N-methyltransferase